MRTFAMELALAGLVVFAVGCKGGDETGDTSDTSDTSDEVPTEETDCNDGDDEDEDGDEDCEDSDCASDPDCLFAIAFISASGGFGYDAANDEVVGVELGGTPIPPVVSITLGNEDYTTTGSEDDACTINLIYNGTDGIPAETWGDYIGFEMPDGKYDIDTDCESLDEELLGTVEDIAASGWGVGIGPESADIADLLDKAVTDGDITEEDRSYYIGGGFFWGAQGVPEPFLDQGIGFGYSVNETFQMLNSDGQVAEASDELAIMTSAEVLEGSLPPSGYYEATSFSGWTFQQ